MNGTVLFWIGLAALACVYAGYPMLLALLAPIFRVRIATDTGLRPVGCLLYPPGDSRTLAKLLDEVLREPRSPALPISAGEDNLARILEVYRKVTGEHSPSGFNG